MSRTLMQRHEEHGASRLLLLCGLGVVAALLVAGASYGRDLLGYYRFSNAVDATSRAEETNAGPWPRLSDVCTPCHGSNGNPAMPLYPRLAGQPAAYLSEQLRDFASGRRANPAMSPLALTLSQEEIEHLAGMFAAQPVVVHETFVADPERVKKGAQLVRERACMSCHGDGLSGREAVPALSGQGHDYLVKQLHDYKSGVRRDSSGLMAAVAGPLSEEDIENAAVFLAAHRGASNAR